MLNSIIDFSIKNKLIIGLFVFFLVAVGAYQITILPIDAVPDITNNQVQVITSAPSYGAPDIERLVTFPVEQNCSNISGKKEIRSFSRFGLSVVTIVFNDEVDIYWARQQVAERLQQIRSEIPSDISPPYLGPISTGLGEIYQYVVKAKKGYEKKYDATSLRTIQDWIVRRQLMGVKGVAEISSFGGKLKQYEIAVDPNKLNAYGININAVFNALETNNENTGGAYIEKGASLLYIRSEGLLKSEEDIKNIAIAQGKGTVPLFIRDIAEVRIGHAIRYGALCYNDEGEVAGAVVMMLKGANSSEVIKNVKARIEQIRKTLPEGVEIEAFLDRTKMVNNAIGTVEKNLLEGALIVVLVLVLFLGNLRAGLLVASVIPLSMLFAICMMNLFGVSGNLMSLGALDFGLIVDGAVIIVESVMHYLAHTRKFKQITTLSSSHMDETVGHSAKKMMNSAVFGQIIILIVYLPIFSLQGIEGKMFKPMAQTVAFALVGAFLLSLTYIPMMSAVVLNYKSKSNNNFSDRMMAQVEKWFSFKLIRILRYPKVILGSISLLFIASVITITRLGGEFIPALEEGDFAVDTRVLTGSNLNTSIQFTQKAAHALKTQFPEVEKVVTKIGSGEVPTDPMPIEASDMMVILKDKSEWTSAKTFPEMEEKMSKALEDIPGITAGFMFPVQMRFNELMTGARQDVVCKIFGENLDTLSTYAEQLGKIAGNIKGAENIYVEPVNGMPQVVIDYNRSLLARHHLSVAEVNKVINTAFAGQSSGLLFEDEKRFDVVVRLDTNSRKNINDIKNLLIPSVDGMQIPLQNIANITIKNGVNQIQREDAKRRIVVGFNVVGRDVESIVNELKQKTETQIKFPIGYYVTYGGAFQNLEEAKNRLMIAVPVSLLLIFLLLYFAFKNLKQGLLIYTAIPLSAIGGIFFLALRQMPFSISAGVGFIALFGVAVLNGIVLITEFNRLRNEGCASIVRIVMNGTRLRLRPVLMTAFVASLGFLPMALSNGAGAEVQRPLATVVIGGLLIATLLTLFVLPLLYMLAERKTLKERILSGKSTVLLIFLLFTGIINSQTKLDLQSAIDTALKNNLVVKQEQLKSAYSQSLIKTAADIPKATINSEFGQYNSSYTDNRFSFTQNIAFPVVYKRQKELLTSEYNQSQWLVNLKTTELRKEVTKTFLSYQLLKKREQILIVSDSLYRDFSAMAELRLKTGESNILEKVTAEQQQTDIRLQLNDLRQELKMVMLRFQFLLNSKTPFLPRDPESGSILLLSPDTIHLQTNPLLEVYKTQSEIEKNRIRLERAKLGPDLSFGVSNTTIRGMGADNITYTSKDRFTSLQLGVALPLFPKAQRARIQGSRTMMQLWNNETELLKTKQKLEIKQLFSRYEALRERLNSYESKGLNNARTIRETANRQFRSGEINYLDYVVLLNQAVSIESHYIDTLQLLTDLVIQINYFTYPTN
ncbi:MAG: CusA/CzcA family heavy metal efflux RND transporter [Sediminibacterium sp.]|nr:CusA/CzcA family heavy metal efflux RND transporter [Sediminibacterium sp.]